MSSPSRLTAILLAAVAACATAAPEPEPEPEKVRSGWNVTDHVPVDDFIIQSHRGAGELAPENTIEAFELGWKLHTWPEADVRTTKDGVIVAFHDSTFARVVRNPEPGLERKGVADVTFEELSRLDVGAWRGEEFRGRRVCALREVFARMKDRPERHLYLDIKQVDLGKLAAEVREAGVGRQVVLAAPRHETILEWKRHLPDSDTLLWLSGTEEQKRAAIEGLRAKDFAGITQIQVHVRLPGDAPDVKPGEPFSPSRAFLAGLSGELSRRGILFQTLPYGATETAIYHQLLDAGLASFATDYPEITWKAVREYYSGRR